LRSTVLTHQNWAKLARASQLKELYQGMLRKA
jgi:hypothetical protein